MEDMLPIGLCLFLQSIWPDAQDSISVQKMESGVDFFAIGLLLLWLMKITKRHYP